MTSRDARTDRGGFEAPPAGSAAPRKRNRPPSKRRGLSYNYRLVGLAEDRQAAWRPARDQIEQLIGKYRRPDNIQSVHVRNVRVALEQAPKHLYHCVGSGKFLHSDARLVYKRVQLCPARSLKLLVQPALVHERGDIERSLYYYRVSPASVFLSFSGVFGRCVCGMMISRLPNSRRSTDVFPGPRRDSAIATIITRIVGSGSWKRFGVGGGNQERPMPAVASATNTVATGVRNPIKTKTPLATIPRPTPQIPNRALPGSVR